MAEECTRAVDDDRWLEAGELLERANLSHNAAGASETARAPDRDTGAATAKLVVRGGMRLAGVATLQGPDKLGS